MNKKRVYRLYREEGLSLRTKKPRRHVSAVRRSDRLSALARNDIWGMDFVSDALYTGQRFRALTIVDLYTREFPAIHVAARFGGEQIVCLLDALQQTWGKPNVIRCDNGPEFISKVLDRWAYANQVKLDFSRLGKPIDNAFVESFNGKFRDECLNYHWFMSLSDAQDKIEEWRMDYNEHRPHTALGNVPPSQFAYRMRLLEDH